MMKLFKNRTLILVSIITIFGNSVVFADNKVVVVPLGSSKPHPSSFAVFAGGNQDEVITNTDEIVRSVTLTAPEDGTVIVNSSHYVRQLAVGRTTLCSISTGQSTTNFAIQAWQSGNNSTFSQMSGTRGFNISEGVTTTYNLACRVFEDGIGAGTANIRDSFMTAIFVPNNPEAALASAQKSSEESESASAP